MSGQTWRLFVAAWPSPEWAEAAHAKLRDLAHPEGRVTPVANLHVTLHFVGSAPAGELAMITASVEHATHGVRAFELQPQRFIALPQRGPARLIAVETDAPAAVVDLNRRLVARLARRPRPSRRPFHPHLTVCRFRAPAPGYQLDQACDLPPIPVTQVDIVRSDLRPDGARYQLVASCPLGSRT